MKLCGGSNAVKCSVLGVTAIRLWVHANITLHKCSMCNIIIEIGTRFTMIIDYWGITDLDVIDLMMYVDSSL